MMLGGTERDLVVQVISQYFGDNQAWHHMLKLQILPHVEPEAQRDVYRNVIDTLPLGNSPRGAAVATLGFLEQQAPAQPLLLPRFLRAINNANANVERAIRKLEDEVAPASEVEEPENPINTQLVLGRQPFLDRSELRPVLQQFLFELDGPCVLIVTGPKRSGKSYTRALVEHVRRRRRDFSTVWVDFGLDVLPPEVVATRLVAQMSRSTQSMPQPGLETTSNYVGKLTAWVVEQALETGKRWCFLLDGLRDEVLLNDTRNFIHQLAGTIEIGNSNDFLRLLLLAYDEPLPNLLPSSIARDELNSPDHVGLVDVQDYFEWLMERSGREVDSEMVRLHARAVIEQCPTDDPERMRALYEAVVVETPTFLPAGSGR